MNAKARVGFQRLIATVKSLPAAPTAVAHPCDEPSLTGAVDAAKRGVIVPILVGPRKKILAVAAAAKLDIERYEIVDADHSDESAEKAVALVREGRAEMLMKGSLSTDELLAALPDLKKIRTGLVHVFIQHTSASLSINENADPDVPADLESSFSAIVPEEFPYRHTIEGPDDMPAHVKASVLGSSLTIPIREGRLALGTWQGVYLCEHRDHASRRTLVLTMHGEA